MTDDRRCVIKSSIRVLAPAALIWKEVTEVDIGSFRHPFYLRALGVPKPLTANVVTPAVGGARVAHFSNGLRFTREITEWAPHESYAFTFSADAGFRVGWLFDLSEGPFRLESGAYRLSALDNGFDLTLTTHYRLSGLFAALLGLPIAGVLRLFQSYLLAGIRRNAERAAVTALDA